MIYSNAQTKLKLTPRNWLITGVAGFIGSNLLEALLNLNQHVVGLDNLSTGFQANIDDVKSQVTKEQWSRFKFIKGDITKIDDCYLACKGVNYVLHHAALGSIPRSLIDPIKSNDANVTGFLNIISASRDEKVDRFIYAASSSTYGDHPGLPKIEHLIGKPLSPYAVTKYINELYAEVFNKCYGLDSIGLRYFNVFGKRQNVNGEYAAVIPKWIYSFLNHESIIINGDGSTSRDFTHIDNVIQANLLAATGNPTSCNQVYNVAVGKSITIKKLFYLIHKKFETHGFTDQIEPTYLKFRKGDVLHSLADISKAQKKLGYHPLIFIDNGINLTIDWYISRNKNS